MRLFNETKKKVKFKPVSVTVVTVRTCPTVVETYDAQVMNFYIKLMCSGVEQ